MSFEFDAPEEIGGGGNFLNAPGTYHMVVTQVLEGQSVTGKIVDGFTVGLDCVDGTVRENNKCSEVGKTCNITFFSGKLTDKDKGQFAKVKQAAFLIAANVIDPKQLGQRVTIDLQKACGHQVILTLEHDDDGKYLRVAGASIYHVDDPRISGVPKDATSLGLIPKSLRHPKEWFDSVMKRKAKSESGNGHAAGGGGTPVGAAMGAKLSDAEMDDL